MLESDARVMFTVLQTKFDPIFLSHHFAKFCYPAI